MWPGFVSRRRRHMWVEFVVGSLPCSERYSVYSGFPLSSKTNTSKFQFDLERTDTFKRTSSSEFLVASRVKKQFNFFWQKCQVPSPCIVWYLECRFLSVMPLSKNHLSTRYVKSESTVSRTIKGSLSTKNICHLRKSIGCFVLSRKRDLSLLRSDRRERAAT